MIQNCPDGEVLFVNKVSSTVAAPFRWTFPEIHDNSGLFTVTTVPEHLTETLLVIDDSLNVTIIAEDYSGNHKQCAFIIRTKGIFQENSKKVKNIIELINNTFQTNRRQ